MHSEHLHIGLECGFCRLEKLAAIPRVPAGSRAVGSNDNGPARGIEDRDIGAAVARIIEPAIAECRDQRVTLHAGGHVAAGLCGDDLVKNAQMQRDRIGKLFGRSRCQDDVTAIRPVLAQLSQKVLPIGQSRGIQIDTRRNFAFQPRLAAHQPERQQKKTEGPAAQEKKQTLPQQIGRNQSAVEIDSQRHCIAFGSRVHKSPRIKDRSSNGLTRNELPKSEATDSRSKPASRFQEYA